MSALIQKVSGVSFIRGMEHKRRALTLATASSVSLGVSAAQKDAKVRVRVRMLVNYRCG